jgi:hypothetical protein
MKKMNEYSKIAKEMIARDDVDEIAAVFRLRDEATAAMIRQCCLADQPDDDEVSDWLGTIPANAMFLSRSLVRTKQKVVKA